MTRSIVRALSLACALAAQSAAAADTAACPVSDKEFLRQITADNDWPGVYSVFKHNLPACRDDGLYADGYTSMVVNALAAHWSELRLLEHLFAQDHRFQDFFFAHIGAAGAEADIKHALSQAQAGCPAQSAAVCRELEKRLRAALEAQR